jgi:hypothetical protein
MMTILIKRLVFAALCFSFWSVASSKTEAESEYKQIKEKLTQADSLYWFAMEEGGNAEALEEGIRILEDAHADLAVLPESNETKALSNRISALRVDLEKQHELSHDTLFGFFPMVRFLSESVFTDTLSLGTFEVADDPAVMASNSACRRLIDILNRATGKYGQFDVIFVSEEINHDLENEALYLFNQDPKFFVHNRYEMLGILGEAYDQTLYALDSNQTEAADWDKRIGELLDVENSKKLVEAFKNPYFLVVTIERLGDKTSPDKFYSVAGRAWDLTDFFSPTENNKKNPELKSAATFTTYGFSRDRNHLFWPIVLGNLLLLFIVAKFPKREGVAFAVMSATAFLFARCWPPIVGTALSGLAPESESLWYLSFWWPLVTFFLLVLAPFVLVRLAKEKFPQIEMIGEVNLADLTPPMTLGLLAALGSDLFIYGSTQGNPLPEELCLIVLLLASSMYLCIRIHASSMNEWKGRLPAIGFASLGLILMAWGYFAYDWRPLSGACFLLWYAFRESKTGEDEKEKAEGENSPEGGKTDSNDDEEPRDLDWLIKETDEPAFQSFEGDGFQPSGKDAEEMLKEGKCVVLRGKSGVGKSRLAKESAKAFIRGPKGDSDGGGHCVFGSCPQPVENGVTSDGNSYGLFRSLFRDHLGMRAFGEVTNGGNSASQMAGAAFARLVPLFGLALTGISKLADGMAPPSGEKEIEKLVKEAILKMGRKGMPLVFVLDDLQWIDEESDGKLLLNLIEWKPKKEGEGLDLYFVITEREKKIAYPSGVKVVEIELSSVQRRKRMQEILTKSLHFDEEAAQEILEQSKGDKDGCLNWLLYGVREYAKKGELEERNGKFFFRKLPDGKVRTISAPSALCDMIERNLADHPEHREVLRHAVMLGENFNASELTFAMRKDRLEVLAMLERAETDTGIVRDLPEKDDWFHIPSFKRKIAADYFRVQEKGPDSKETPQVVRETHFRIAEGLEKLPAGNFETTQKIADHYYFSGPYYASKAVERNEVAARMEADRYQFQAAIKRLKRALECVSFDSPEKRDELEREILILECRDASKKRDFEGSKKALKRCKDWLEKNSKDMTIGVLSLRMRHEVAGEYKKKNETEGEKRWRENIMEAERMLGTQGLNNLEKAEVLHFKTLALDRNLSLVIAEQDKEKRKEVYSCINDLYTQIVALLENRSDAENKEIDSAQRVLAEVLNSWGHSLLWSKDGDMKSNLLNSEEHYSRSIEIKKALGDLEGQAISNGGLGFLWQNKKDFAKAIKSFEEARALNEQIGSYENVVLRYLNIVDCHHKVRNSKEAEKNLGLAQSILDRGLVTDSADFKRLSSRITQLKKSFGEVNKE